MNKLLWLMLITVLISVGSASIVHKQSPLEVIDQHSPLVTWRIDLETDSDGNYSVTWPRFEGKIYSIDTINASLSQSTNVTIKRIDPYETTIQTIDAFAGNNTTYPRINGEMYILMGETEFSILNGQDNVTVPVYLTLER